MSKFTTLYSSYGQSVWLDYIDRNLLVNGGLRELVSAGVRGVTSNPTIFQKGLSIGAQFSFTGYEDYYDLYDYTEVYTFSDLDYGILEASVRGTRSIAERSSVA